MLAILTFCVFIGFTATNSAADQKLGDAIEQFNSEAKNDSIGASQQPLTEAEVIAAIRLWNDPNAPISEEMLASFKEVAQTKALPGNASIEKLTGYDRGRQHVFDVWSVRIRFERSDGSSFAFLVRETMVGSRTLQEELDRIKNSTGKFQDGERMPGWHRIESRISELEKRIADSTKAE